MCFLLQNEKNIVWDSKYWWKMTQFCCAYEKLEQKHKLNIWLSVFFQDCFENLVFLLLLVELRTMDKVSEYLSLEKAIFMICFMIFFISIAVQYMVSMNSFSRDYFSHLLCVVSARKCPSWEIKFLQPNGYHFVLLGPIDHENKNEILGFWVLCSWYTPRFFREF